jgi:hypothetical protein
MDGGAVLTHDNGAGADHLTLTAFDSQPFARCVAAIAGGSACFFM